jgi:hypothetical protein
MNEDRVKNDWGAMAARLALQERSEDPEFQDNIRFRPLVEGVFSDFKRRKSQIRNTRRRKDPSFYMDSILRDCDDEKLSEMAEQKIEAILEAAEMNVGWARLAELLADAFVDCCACVVRWGWRFHRRAEFGAGFSFPPLIVIRESDVPDEAAAQALLRKIELEFGRYRSFEFDELIDPNNGVD